MTKHKHQWIVFQLNLPESYVIQKQVPNPNYKESDIIVTSNIAFTGSTLTSGSFTRSIFNPEPNYGEQKYKTIPLPTMVLVCICGKWRRLIAEEVLE